MVKIVNKKYNPYADGSRPNVYRSGVMEGLKEAKDAKGTVKRVRKESDKSRKKS